MSCIRRLLFFTSVSSDQSQHLCSRSHTSRGREGTMCAGLWHGEVRRLPAHFIHPCWQPRLLFTLCSAHMASKTHHQSTDYFLKHGGPLSAPEHQDAPGVRRQQHSSTTASFPPVSSRCPWARDPLQVDLIHPISHQSYPLQSPLLFYSPLHSFLHLLLPQLFVDERHRGGAKTTPDHLQNLIWPRMGSSVCYIIWCLHSPGSPVFSLSAFYRMQICCSAPNKMHQGCNKYRIFSFLSRKDKLYVK